MDPNMEYAFQGQPGGDASGMGQQHDQRGQPIESMGGGMPGMMQQPGQGGEQGDGSKTTLW